MKTLLSVAIALISTTLVIEDADARRFGGGRNLGMQRSAPAQQQAAPKAPAQQQQQQAAPATPAQQPAGASKWLGPLAGFTLGAGLAALFLNNGLAGLLAGLLLISLIIAGLALAARALMRGRIGQEPLQYAGAGAGTQPVPGTLAGGAGTRSVASVTSRWPAGFNAAEFVRHARLNFVRLQEAHDRKDLSTMRDFLAPDVYREIEADIRAAGDSESRTEVLTLEAEVLEVVEERGSYIVSVRFSGMIREAADRGAEPFSEIWHLEKPLDGSSGWVVAGIQQS
ncbi:MAG TPA: Tim44-like domain-containing protein [Burkholderiales bacterium]|nr:Tim44-like domain-containing protein [Burkholderiales bacterium]